MSHEKQTWSRQRSELFRYRCNEVQKDKSSAESNVWQLDQSWATNHGEPQPIMSEETRGNQKIALRKA